MSLCSAFVWNNTLGHSSNIGEYLQVGVAKVPIYLNQWSQITVASGMKTEGPQLDFNLWVPGFRLAGYNFNFMG